MIGQYARDRGHGRATGARARAEVTRGRPANALLTLSERVDLLVIGSRRWGPAARLLLGSTGSAVMHNAAARCLPCRDLPGRDRSVVVTQSLRDPPDHTRAGTPYL